MKSRDSQALEAIKKILDDQWNANLASIDDVHRAAVHTTVEVNAIMFDHGLQQQTAKSMKILATITMVAITVAVATPVWNFLDSWHDAARQRVAQLNAENSGL